MCPTLKLLAMSILLSCPGLQCDQPKTFTVPGPEADDLAPRSTGTIVMDLPVGGIETVRLPTLERATPRKPDENSLPVHCVSGPDRQGRIAFVENDMLNKRHALKTIGADGQTETIFEAAGDALWENAVGGHLAFDPTGAAVALVARCKGVQNRSPDAQLMEGELEIWRTEQRDRVPNSVRAMDDTLSWSPDGKWLVFTALVDTADAATLLRMHVKASEAFGSKTSGWKRVPVVHELDVETGKTRALHVGERPLLSTDGKLLLVRDFELHWRVLDLASNVSKPFEAPGAIYPGALAFVDPNTVLFWAWPTEGAEAKFTEHNSPLAGAKQMRALKLVDLRDGRFQTVVPFVDPRRRVGFGR